MRLLQLYEYLELLNGGVSTHTANPALARECLRQAEMIWPQLGISSWSDRERLIEFVAVCRATEYRLVHVTADWKSCFLILVLPARGFDAESYFLFDIGAEYSEPRFICPAFGVDQVADAETIQTRLPQLAGRDDSFAILESGAGTYLQASAESGMFHVEHQLVSLSSHYCLEERVDARTVVEMFLSCAFGNKEWAGQFKWKKVEF